MITIVDAFSVILCVLYVMPKIPCSALIVVIYTHFQLKPTGALDYPNLDEASVKLLTRGDTEKVGVTITPVQESNRLHIDAKYNESVREWDKQKDDYLTDIEIPMVHNIDVQASQEANVDIKDFMESKFINVSTEQGT